jgi:hypothetical protein
VGFHPTSPFTNATSPVDARGGGEVTHFSLYSQHHLPPYTQGVAERVKRGKGRVRRGILSHFSFLTNATYPRRRKGWRRGSGERDGRRRKERQGRRGTWWVGEAWGA